MAISHLALLASAEEGVTFNISHSNAAVHNRCRPSNSSPLTQYLFEIYALCFNDFLNSRKGDLPKCVKLTL